MAWIQKISDTLLKGRQEVEDTSSHQYDTVTVHVLGDKDLAIGPTDDLNDDYCQIDLPGPKGKKKSKPKRKASEDDSYDYVRGLGETKKDSSGYEIVDHEGQKGGQSKKLKKGISKYDDYHYVRDCRGAIRGDKKRPVSIAAVPREVVDGNYTKLLMGTKDTERDYDLPGPWKDQTAASSEKTKGKKFKLLKGKVKRQPAFVEDDDTGLYENNDYDGTPKLKGVGGVGADKKRPVSIAPEVAGNYTKLVMGTKEKEKDYDVPEASAKGRSSIDAILKEFTATATATATSVEADPGYYENNDYHGVEGDKLKSPVSKGKSKNKKKAKKVKIAEEPTSYYENNDYNDPIKPKQDESQKEGDKKKLKSKGKSKDDEYDYVRDFRGVKKGDKKCPVSIEAVPADGNYTKLLMGTKDTEKDYDLPGPWKEGEKSKDKKKSKSKGKGKGMVENDSIEDENDYVINDYQSGSTPSGGKLQDSKLFKLLKKKSTEISEDDSYDYVRGLGETKKDSSGYEIVDHGGQSKTVPGSKLLKKMKSALKGKTQHMSEDDAYDYVRDIGEIKK